MRRPHLMLLFISDSRPRGGLSGSNFFEVFSEGVLYSPWKRPASSFTHGDMF
jgi:hypothetical protein